MPATVLGDINCLAKFLDASRQDWRTVDDRVAATLWWFTTSSILCAPLVTTAMITGTIPDAVLARTRLHLDGRGRIAGAHVDAAVNGLPQAAESLRKSLVTVISGVCAVTGMRPAPLWAIATDSLANRALRVGRAIGSERSAEIFAVTLAGLIGRPFPVPRFEDVQPAEGKRVRFVRRASCCLICQLGHQMCESCPRQSPELRQQRLVNAAARFQITW